MLVKRCRSVAGRRGGILRRHYCRAHQNRTCNCHAKGGQRSGSSHYFLPRAKGRIAKAHTMLYKPAQVKVAIFVSILGELRNFCCKPSQQGCLTVASTSPASIPEWARWATKILKQNRYHMSKSACQRRPTRTDALDLQASYAST